MGNGRNSRTETRYGRATDAEDTPIEAGAAAIENRFRDLPIRSKQGLIRLSRVDNRSEEQDEDEVLQVLTEVIDLTGENPSTKKQPESQPLRNPPVLPEVLIDHYDLGGVKLKPGSTVEIPMLEGPQLFQASFLWITHIINTSSGIKLRGIPLTRARNLRGRLDRLRNELAMILHVDADDNRPEEVQAAIEIPVTDVIRARNCHLTNADFPQHRTVLGIHSNIANLEQDGVLMCRWRCIFIYKDSITRIAHINQTQKNAVPVEFILEHLNAKQVNKQRFVVPETSRFNIWRGGKTRGGEHDPENENSLVNRPVVRVDGEEDPESVIVGKKSGQRYTFGDMFSGAGGASCGARKAGFQIKVACDHHVGACNTYTEVFPEAQLYEMDIFEFITSEDVKIRVDVLHLSPPCQYWSPAHTVVGVNDDANIAALFACHELIRKLRPRLFTLEQTYGILHPKFEFYFNALVHGFTQYNYSVRWKIVNLVEWGSPAARKRLVMIGSCPGEELPPFPKATHVAPGVEGRGKKPYVTVKKMLKRIPRDASKYDDMHQPHEMGRKRFERWDPDVTLKRCITTNGGSGNYHPNGRRDFTLREYATLQTFPVDYPFRNPDRKKQIGNAFPPMVVKVLYTHLRKWLENKDRVYAIENEPIDLDDPDVELLDLEDELMDDAANDDEDVEYIHSRHLSSSSNGGASTYRDDMDLGISDGDYDHVQCIDPNQQRRAWGTIDLTRD
ncbi:S-adenosyl-L-methionine-dependent methyltransferase [Xylaria digitata]|nr:S-adenosyl-L-methionine-dependent methyltransferase [Xylaria digitata]